MYNICYLSLQIHHVRPFTYIIFTFCWSSRTSRVINQSGANVNSFKSPTRTSPGSVLLTSYGSSSLPVRVTLPLPWPPHLPSAETPISISLRACIGNCLLGIAAFYIVISPIFSPPLSNVSKSDLLVPVCTENVLELSAASGDCIPPFMSKWSLACMRRGVGVSC